MAGFTLPGQVPYNAVSGPSDFAVAQNAALRKRKMAEMLQAQAYKPNEVGLIPGSKMSLANPLAALLNSYVSNKLDKESDAEEAAANRAAQEGLDDAIKNMPRPTAGVPSMPIEQEQVGPGPIAPQAAPDPLAAAFGPGGMPGAGVPPKDNEFKGSGSAMAAQLLGGAPPTPSLAPEGPSGPPLLPQKMDMAAPGMLPKLATDAIPAKSVAPEEMFKFAAGLSKFGPQGAEMGKELRAGAAKEMTMIPKADIDPYTVAGDSIFNKKTGKWEAQSPSSLAKQQDARDAKTQASEDKRYVADEANARARDIAASNNETKRALHSVLGALGGAGNTTDVGVDMTGMPVVRGKDGRRYTMDNNTGKATPYNGEVIPQVRHEKNVADYMAAQTDAAMADKAAAAIENKAAADAFDTIKRGKMGLGMSPQQAGVSKEGQAVLAMTGRDFAEQTKKLYGASFTDSEQRRAAGFTITNKDDQASAAVKARDAARFAREMADKYGGAAAAAAARRLSPGSGGGSGAAPAAGGGGKNVTVDY